MKTGKILDPIHGLIEITEIEEYIINQRMFGRLRKIKQNTLLNYIFPGANHTRFEHSIGVMHLAETIFNKSNENVETTRLKNEKYGTQNDFKSLAELLNNDQTSLAVITQELRLAALLHDVGHGPTSHKFDDFTIKGEQLISILEGSPEHSAFIKELKDYITKKGGQKVDHEIMSCVFIIKLIYILKNEPNFTNHSKEIISRIDVKNILTMIEPDLLPEHKIRIGEKDCTNYFNSIIAGFPFDADRMDYLYRDSFYSGVKYGFFDQSRILTSLLPVEHKGKITLGVKKSGLDSVIRFIQSRNHLYNQVYFHKTNSATNSMLDFVFRHMEGQSIFESVDSYKDLEELYLRNGDEYFFNVTLKKKLSENGCNVCAEGCIENEVLDELLERKLWKKVYEARKNVFYNEIDLKTVTKVDYEQRLKEKMRVLQFEPTKLKYLQKTLENEGIDIRANYSQNIGLKGFSKSKMVLIEKDNPINTREDWNNLNDELFFLSQTNVFIKRLYVRRTFKDANELINIQKRIDNLMDELDMK